jgi:tungstate transport system substrate-binding protein
MKGIFHGISTIALILALLCTAAAAQGGAGEGQKERLRISTTTSLYDTGLLEELEKIFEEIYNVDVHTVSGGTGIAIQYGERGDVDLILVHDVARERKFIEEGYGLSRSCFAYNYFIIVGPEDDPAGIRGMGAAEAMKTIMDRGIESRDLVKFISRGDDSGTHAREKLLWKAAGIDYEKVRSTSRWYIEAGKGMGPTLVMANELGGYTLCDTSTFEAFRGDQSLVPLIEEDKALLNVYAAIPVSPSVHPGVNCEMAAKFVDLLVSEEGQDLIGEYGTDTIGKHLFKAARGNCDLIGCAGDECVTSLPEDACILAAE